MFSLEQITTPAFVLRCLTQFLKLPTGNGYVFFFNFFASYYFRSYSSGYGSVLFNLTLSCFEGSMFVNPFIIKFWVKLATIVLPTICAPATEGSGIRKWNFLSFRGMKIPESDFGWTKPSLKQLKMVLCSSREVVS
jgi:hypothetical protein